MAIDPFFGSLALGGLSALGNLGGGIMSAAGANAQNEAARQAAQSNLYAQYQVNQDAFRMADENRRFQADMANTAYQRATFDMRQAGINPMLAYMKGGADGAPGAMGVQGTPRMDNPMPQNPGAELGRGISRAVGSALDAYQTINQVENIKATTDQSRAAADKLNQDARTGKAEELQKLAQTKLTEGQEKLLEQQKGLLLGQTSSAYSQSGYYGAAAREREEQARRTRVNADKEETHGFGTPADLADTAEKAARRISEQLRQGNGGTIIERNFRPFTGLKNSHDDDQWRHY